MSIKVMRCMLKGQRRCVLHDTDDLGVKARGCFGVVSQPQLL